MTSKTAQNRDSLRSTRTRGWWGGWWSDVLLATGVAAFGFAAMPDIHMISLQDVLLFCLHGLVVMTVRRAPVATACVDSALRVAAPLVGLGYDDYVVPPLVIAAVAGTVTRPRVAVAVSGGLWLSFAISVVTVRGVGALVSDGFVQFDVELVVATFLGVLARRERLALVAALERARRTQQRALVAAERARAAGALQVAVGDGLQQVAAAARDLDRLTNPPPGAGATTAARTAPVAAALRRVQRCAQSTLTTTRQVLDIVRSTPLAPDRTPVGPVGRRHEWFVIDVAVVGLASAVVFGSSLLVWLVPSVTRWLAPFGVSVEPVPIALFVVGLAIIFARHRHPVAALLIGTAAVVGNLWVGTPSLMFVLPIMLVLVFSVASQVAAGRALVVVFGALAVFLVALIWSPHYPHSFPGPSPFQLVIVALVPSTVLAGVGVQVGRDRVTVATEQQRAAAAENEVARLQERRSVARDVHDMLAHQLSGIAVQAGTAASLITRRPGLAVEAAQSIAEALRETEQAFPRLIGGTDELPDRLDRDALDRLAAGLRHAGALVTTVVDGTVPVTPGEADRAAAQILREALTNVLRHAGPVPTTVRVTHEPGQVRLTVHDSGTTTRADGPCHHPAPGGHGLRGMRERAELVGGELRAGAGSDGWTVTATLPRAST